MLAAARSSLEELGFRHGLLETDLFTGVVELLAGDPSATVAPLRPACEDLGTLGVVPTPARPLLARDHAARPGRHRRGRADGGRERGAHGPEPEVRGSRGGRRRRAVFTVRGGVDDGVALAREAVEIAAATDLVLDHADTCVVLADLRDEAGDHAAPARRVMTPAGSTRRRVRRCGQADHAGARPARRSIGAAGPAAGTIRCRGPDIRRRERRPRFMEQFRRTFNDPDSTVLGQLLTPDRVHDDRRSIVALVDARRSRAGRGFRRGERTGPHVLTPEVIAVRGERLTLTRMVARTPAGDESLAALRQRARHRRPGSRTPRSPMTPTFAPRWRSWIGGTPLAKAHRRRHAPHSPGVLPVAAVVQEVHVVGDAVLAVCIDTSAPEAHADVVRVAEGAVASHEGSRSTTSILRTRSCRQLGAPGPAGVELSNQPRRWFVLDGLTTCNATPTRGRERSPRDHRDRRDVPGRRASGPSTGRLDAGGGRHATG